MTKKRSANWDRADKFLLEAVLSRIEIIGSKSKEIESYRRIQHGRKSRKTNSILEKKETKGTVLNDKAKGWGGIQRRKYNKIWRWTSNSNVAWLLFSPQESTFYQWSTLNLGPIVLFEDCIALGSCV